jgi:pyruvate dehydrogenase complex dehydrogenase (E1) component
LQPKSSGLRHHGRLGSVRGHRVEALGVEHFGQTGTIGDLYRHHGIDANAIIDAAESLTAGAPVRHRKMRCSVVPAKAGAHTPRRMLFCQVVDDFLRG